MIDSDKRDPLKTLVEWVRPLFIAFVLAVAGGLMQLENIKGELKLFNSNLAYLAEKVNNNSANDLAFHESLVVEIKENRENIKGIEGQFTKHLIDMHPKFKGDSHGK